MGPSFTTFRVTGLGVSAVVACDCAEFWSYAQDHLLLPGWSVEVQDHSAGSLLVHRESENLFKLCQGSQVHARGALDEVVMRLASLVHHQMAGATNLLIIHAGAVEYRDRVLLFPGRSYSGKSTLVKALVDAGCLYYSDEYAVIDPESGAVLPFARGIHLRYPTPAVFRPCADRCADPRHRGRLGAVFELTYLAENAFYIKPQKRSECVLNLFSNTVAARRFGGMALRILERVTKGVSAWQGTRGDAAEAVGAILEKLS